MFLEAEPENGRAVLGAADSEFVVTFAGTHGIAQGLDTIVRAAPLLEGEASFALVGDGPLKAPLVQLAAEAGVRNVAFHAAGAARGDAAASRCERRLARPALRAPDLPRLRALEADRRDGGRHAR